MPLWLITLTAQCLSKAGTPSSVQWKVFSLVLRRSTPFRITLIAPYHPLFSPHSALSKIPKAIFISVSQVACVLCSVCLPGWIRILVEVARIARPLDPWHDRPFARSSLIHGVPIHTVEELVVLDPLYTTHDMAETLCWIDTAERGDYVAGGVRDADV